MAASKSGDATPILYENRDRYYKASQEYYHGVRPEISMGISSWKTHLSMTITIKNILLAIIALALTLLASTGVTVPVNNTSGPSPDYSHSPPPSPPPEYELIEIEEIPLPLVAPSDEVGACTPDIDPRGMGCISREHKFQGGDFTPDGNHVIATVNFVGASEKHPSRAWSGEQAILVKTDGTTFNDGETWKCLTCKTPEEQRRGVDPKRDYPHVFRSGDKAIWGHNIIECNGYQLSSEECISEKISVYPIYWATVQDGIEVNGAVRELRVHPDNEHLGWSSFTGTGGQSCFFGRLVFNPNPTTGNVLVPRYELVSVNLLHYPNRNAQWTTKDKELIFHDNAIQVGELRGFSGTGDEIIYIGPSWEANNIDVFAVHLITGTIRRLTQHPEYTDPVAFSADNQWIIAMDTRGSNRQMFMSGMRHIPPIIDLVTITAAASTRNNGKRRFFQPILLDKWGDRANYFGQDIRADQGDQSNGAINDPNWNGRADPAFSPDGSKITYWQSIVSSPECGAANPIPCPIPTTEGRRTYRLLLARLTTRTPRPAPPVFNAPDRIPWAMSFPANATLPPLPKVRPGMYTLRGRISGTADVSLGATSPSDDINVITATYRNYSDVEGYVLNGYENVTRTVSHLNPWANVIDWYSDIEQTGVVNASKKTSREGFRLEIDAMVNVFRANGTLTTRIEDVEYRQPENGT